jgi:hypothetical protein
MERRTFTASDLATACTGGDVPTMARLLNGACAKPSLAETVDDEKLAALGKQAVDWTIVANLLVQQMTSNMRSGLVRLLLRAEGSGARG